MNDRSTHISQLPRLRNPDEHNTLGNLPVNSEGGCPTLSMGSPTLRDKAEKTAAGDGKDTTDLIM